jgi:hypothetical protein
VLSHPDCRATDFYRTPQVCYFRLVFLGEGMRRREFVALLSGAAIARPLGARAEQSEPLRQVGVLSLPPETCPRSLEWDAAFRKRLNELGWVDSHNLHLDCRYGARARWQCRAHAAIRRRAGGA